MATEAVQRRPDAPVNGLDAYFGITERGSTIGTEVVAGLTTFMVMAYIIFLNPVILTTGAKIANQDLPFNATVAATCLVSAVMTIAMGLYANYPFALAPGLGLNSIVAFQLIANNGLDWRAAMGVVFMEGMLITILVVTGLREAVADAIPLSLKRAISVGIGLFILFIGFYTGGLVRVPIQIGQVVQQPPPVPLSLGDFTSLPVIVTIVGLGLTAWLMAARVRAGILIGILATTGLAIVLHYATGKAVSSVPGKAILPAQLFSLPDFSTIGAGVNFGALAQMGVIALLLTVFALMLSDFFDTIGTVIGIGTEARWLDERGRLPRMNRVLLVDSLAAAAGGAASASTATTYIESAAGVGAGGRTGLTSLVVGVLFLLGLFVAPIAGVVPPEATAPALIIIGFYMAAIVREIPLEDFEEGFPALLALIVMPLTWSITNGVGAGFVAYCFIKLLRGRARAVHPLMWLSALAFILYFALWR
ncbi:MAG: NCS2 family permease [Chloroflexi bacterium]|nr:NCS2 family permease [Chloroflexota bacterium]